MPRVRLKHVCNRTPAGTVCAAERIGAQWDVTLPTGRVVRLTVSSVDVVPPEEDDEN